MFSELGTEILQAKYQQHRMHSEKCFEQSEGDTTSKTLLFQLSDSMWLRHDHRQGLL